MPDKFLAYTPDLDSPSSDGFPITPADGTLFTQPTRFIYVGGAGTVNVQMSNKAQTNTFLSFTCPAGFFLRVRAQRVFANSTATLLVGMF